MFNRFYNEYFYYYFIRYNDKVCFPAVRIAR